MADRGTSKLLPFCPDCGVGIGEEHKPGCDVARCPACGGQELFDDCPEEDLAGLPRQRWTGEWPGVAECREFGWYCVPTIGHSHRCGPGVPGAREDLVRLAVEAVWDREKGRFVLPNGEG